MSSKIEDLDFREIFISGVEYSDRCHVESGFIGNPPSELGFPIKMIGETVENRDLK